MEDSTEGQRSQRMNENVQQVWIVEEGASYILSETLKGGEASRNQLCESHCDS